MKLEGSTTIDITTEKLSWDRAGFAGVLEVWCLEKGIWEQREKRALSCSSPFSKEKQRTGKKKEMDEKRTKVFLWLDRLERFPHELTHFLSIAFGVLLKLHRRVDVCGTFEVGIGEQRDDTYQHRLHPENGSPLF